MTALLQWTTANPFRAFLAAGFAALVSLIALPMAAWLPAGVVVLSLLAGGPPVAVAAGAGAAIALVWAFAPAFGPGPAFLIAIAALLPSAARGRGTRKEPQPQLRVPGADGGFVPPGAGDPRPARRPGARARSGHREARADAAAHGRDAVADGHRELARADRAGDGARRLGDARLDGAAARLPRAVRGALGLQPDCASRDCSGASSVGSGSETSSPACWSRHSSRASSRTA